MSIFNKYNEKSVARKARIFLALFASVFISIFFKANTFATVEMGTKSLDKDFTINFELKEKDTGPVDPELVDPIPDADVPDTGYLTKETTEINAKTIALPIIIFASVSLISFAVIKHSKMFKKSPVYQTININNKRFLTAPLLIGALFALPAIVFYTIPTIATNPDINPFTVSASVNNISMSAKQGESALKETTITLATDSPNGYSATLNFGATYLINKQGDKIPSINHSMIKSEMEALTESAVAISFDGENFEPIEDSMNLSNVSGPVENHTDAIYFYVKTSSDQPAGNYSLASPSLNITANSINDLYDFYSVSYNINDGESGTPIPETKLINSRNLTEEFFVLPEIIPTREGYVFGGWNTKADGTGTTYQPGDKAALDSGFFNRKDESNLALELYATWYEESDGITYHYALTYNLEGVENQELFVRQELKTTDEEVSFAIPNAIPERKGYLFVEFNTKQDESGDSYVSGNTVILQKDGNQIINLYAIFKEKTAKAILTTDHALNFVFDNQTYNIGDEYSYRLDDGSKINTSVIEKVYLVPKRAYNSDDDTYSGFAGWTRDLTKEAIEIDTVNFDSNFIDFEPTSTAGWFFGAISLNTISGLEYLNTSKAIDMCAMFAYNYSLTSLTLPDGFGQNAADMNAMFIFANSLTSLNFPTGFGQNATFMSAMFEGVRSLTSLTLPDGFGQKAEEMGYMFNLARSLTSLNLPKGFGQNATGMESMFQCMSSLTSLALPDNFGQNAIDIRSMFEENRAIVTLSFPAGFGKNATKLYNMFESASSLTSLTFPEGFGQNAEDLQRMFGHTSSLTSLTFPAGFGQNATNMNFMFTHASKLASLTFPEGFGQNAVNMNEMFSHTSSLTSLTLSEGFGQNAVDLSGMFYNAYIIASLTFPEGFGQNAVNMHEMFSHTSSLTSLTLPEGFGQKATDMGFMFNSASSLTSITFPEGFGQNVINTRYMFSNATSLERIYVSAGTNWNMEKVTDSYKMFEYATKLVGGAGTKFSIDNPADKTYAHIDGGEDNPGYFTYKCFENCAAKAILTTDGNLDLVYDDITYVVGTSYIYDNGEFRTSTISKSYNVPTNSHVSLDNNNNPIIPADFDGIVDWVKESTLVGAIPTPILSVNVSDNFYYFEPTSTAGWFARLSNLITVTNLSNLNMSEVTDMTAMFAESSNIKSLDVSKWDTGKVEIARCAFSELTQNKTLDVSNWNTSSLINARSMFGNNSSIQSLNVSKWNTNSLENARSMFFGLTNIEQINVSDWDTSSLKNARGMFYGLTNVTEIDVSNWNTSNLEDTSLMFYKAGQNSESFSLDLSSWDTSKVTDMSGMFRSSGAKTVYVGNGWTTANVTRSDNMFNSGYYNNEGVLPITGGAGTTWNSSNPTDKTYARIDRPDLGQPGYFTDACELYGTCVTTSPAPTQTSTPTYSYNYTPSTETPVAEEPEEAPVSTSSEKKEVKKSETEQEQTNPLGVEKSVEESSTVDTATIAVIVASFVLVSAGAVIIFMIERKRSREDGEY